MKIIKIIKIIKTILKMIERRYVFVENKEKAEMDVFYSAPKLITFVQFPV